MKILGYTISKANTATNPSPVGSVSLQEQLQKTKPSRPLRSSFPRADLGDSGTSMLHGIITEEYNSQLQGVQGIKVYDEMRKSDGTVRAAILACTLPIRRAKWFVNPATEDQQDKDIANFIELALFDWLEDMTWDDVIRQALLMVPFGVMCFEKVYGIKENEGKSYVTLKKLAPRLPKSILQWELVDGTFGIQQIRQDGVLSQIPGSKLLIFVNEREGDNWWGTSMIRAAYPHWYRKNQFYKIDAIAFERQGLGVPYFKMPQGYTDADEKQASKVLQNLRANESAYLLIPPDYEAGFLDMGNSTTRDPEKSINHHNKEILMSVLAQFLELGQSSNGGSKALSQDHSDIFLKALESLANTLIGEINKNLIPELVDLNFNDIKVYPVLDFSGIIKADVAALGTAYGQLVTAGGITPTEGDQQYLRAAMGLPPRTQEDIDSAADNAPDGQSQKDGMDIEPEGDDDDLNESGKKPETPEEKKKTDTAVKKKTTASEIKKGNEFVGWRPLTFAEKKVDWEKIQTTMDMMEADLSSEAKATLTKAKDAFLAKLHTAVNQGDKKAIESLSLGFQKSYADLLKSAYKKAYTYGKNTASSEMEISAPANPNESMTNINLVANTVATKTAADIEAKAKLSIANHMKQNTSVLEAMGLIDSDLQEAIEKAVQHTSAIGVGKNINSGRFDVFARNSDLIQSVQRSEILDKNTCDFCLSMDGLVTTMDDPWAAYDTFHENCRGIWVQIMKDEQDAPDITGIPENIAKYYGGQTNELIQPPRPIVKPGSPASDYVQKKESAKKK